MPLVKTGTEKSVGENISIEKHAHPDMPMKQAIAIAENTKREANKDHECPFEAKAPGAASPAARVMDFGYGEGSSMGHDGSHMPVKCDTLEYANRVHQMWGANEHDPENSNGIVTPQ
jgi:hypothetical protein